MRLATVTERPMRLEPTDKDPFIADLPASAGSTPGTPAEIDSDVDPMYQRAGRGPLSPNT